MTPKNSVDDIWKEYCKNNKYGEPYFSKELFVAGYQAAQAEINALKKSIEDRNQRVLKLSIQDQIVFGSSLVEYNDGIINRIPIEKAVIMPKEEIEQPLLNEIEKLKKQLEIAKDALDEIQGITIWGLKQDATDGIEPIDWRYYAQKALKQIEEIGK